MIGKVIFLLGLGMALPLLVWAETAIRLPQAKIKKDLYNQFGSRSVGHNVSTTTVTLPKNEISVGTMFVGFGVTDNWLLGISPFVLSTYQMYNVASRWAWTIDQDRILLGVEYFKTFGDESDTDRRWQDYCDATLVSSSGAKNCHPEGFNTFKMEAWDIKLTYGRQILSDYRLNVTASYYYYIDDERPFSLRMDPQNNDRYAANLTSLHELRFSRNFYLNLEGGVWGMNYQYPYLHYGGTLNFQSDNRKGLIAFGASVTQSPSFPVAKAKKFYNYDSRQSVHPEMQLQYYF